MTDWCQDHTRGISAGEVRQHPELIAGSQMRIEEVATVMSARKSGAARYIFYKAIIELLHSCSKDDIGNELGTSLENSMFGAYRAEWPADSSAAPFRQELVDLQAELIGELSQAR